MKVIQSIEKVDIPEGVKVTSRARVVRVTGKRGLLLRDFKHLAVEINVIKNQIEVIKYFGTRKDVAAVRTVASHIQNMIKGVTHGFKKTMKAVYAHFPINLVISDKGDSVTIRNFLGEKRDRLVDMKQGVKVSATGNKDEIQIEGNDIELVAKCAALIQQKCKVRNKDIRKFLDGVYVSDFGALEA